MPLLPPRFQHARKNGSPSWAASNRRGLKSATGPRGGWPCLASRGIGASGQLDGDALVSSVASGAGTEVLGGHLGRGDAAAFWIGER